VRAHTACARAFPAHVARHKFAHTSCAHAFLRKATINHSLTRFSFRSSLGDRYDYVLNICGNLNYDDDTCVSGSSVCQRHKHTQISTDVYGFENSIKLSWDDPDANATNTYVEPERPPPPPPPARPPPPHPHIALRACQQSATECDEGGWVVGGC
jgi:hypothetical protein